MRESENIADRKMLQTYIEKRLQTERKNLAGRKNVTDRQTEKKCRR